MNSYERENVLDTCVKFNHRGNIREVIEVIKVPPTKQERF